MQLPDKTEIRRLIASLRNEHTPEWIEEKSAFIMERILSTEQYRSAGAVFAYMALPGEIKTDLLIRQCRRDGKKTAFPKVEGKGIMHFYEVKSPDQMKEGVWHIMEPDPELCLCVDDIERALVIMPGEAYDKGLNRIGYGGGFYDRYLQKHPFHVTIAPAFSFQILEQVPHSGTDVRPQMIITEDSIYGGS